MTYVKIIFLLILAALSACGKHDASNSSFIRPSQKTSGDASSIFLDIKTGNVTDFASKLSAVSDINAVYDDGNTLLTFATEQNKPAIVKILIENGADPGIANKGGVNSLDIARQNNYLAIWLMLDPTKQAEEQEKLFTAVLNNKVGDLRKSLQSGVDPNFVHSTGETPLTQAVKLKNKGIGSIRELGKWVDANGVTTTNLELPNAEGKTPYQVAVEMNESKVLAEFKKLGFP